MLVVPLQAVASQVVSVALATQPCRLKVYQKRTGLYVDLSVQAAPIFSGVIALNANLMVRDAYLGFVGDLAFFDTQGLADPSYVGLGSRWVLMYLEASDLP